MVAFLLLIILTANGTVAHAKSPYGAYAEGFSASSADETRACSTSEARRTTDFSAARGRVSTGPELYVYGRRVSEHQLNSVQAVALDETLQRLEALTGRTSDSCELDGSGWYCEIGDYICYCDWTKLLPTCECTVGC